MGDQVEHLLQGFIRWKNTLSLSDLSELPVVILDHVCRIDNLADLRRILEEGGSFYTAPGLVTELLAAAREHKLLSLEKQWFKQDLVAVDELGYVPYTAEGAQLLFRFLAGRYERGSVLITSNLEFSEWVQVFGDERMTAALLDRLAHHAHILVMNGESYRFRQSLKRYQRKDWLALHLHIRVSKTISGHNPANLG